MVEKRVTSLDRVGHRDSVALGAQQVPRQQSVGLDVLVAGERGPSPDRRGQCPFECGYRIVGPDAGAHVGCQIAQDALGRRPARAVAKARLSRAFHPLPEEAPRKGAARGRRVPQVGVEPLEQPGTDRRGRLPGPETPDLRFLEDVVACEHLIGAFAGQDHLVAARADQPGKHHERRGRGAQDGRLDVPHEPREHLGDVRAPAHDLRMRSTEALAQGALVGSFVELRILEGHGERPQRGLRAVPDHRRDDRRVQAPAQVGADGYVCPELQPDGVDQDRAQLLGRVVRRACTTGRFIGKRPVPVPAEAGPACLCGQRVPGRQ